MSTLLIGNIREEHPDRMTSTPTVAPSPDVSHAWLTLTPPRSVPRLAETDKTYGAAGQAL